MACYCTFPISNLTPGSRLDFSQTYFNYQESHLEFFFLILFSLLKIKQKEVVTPNCFLKMVFSK